MLVGLREKRESLERTETQDQQEHKVPMEMMVLKVQLGMTDLMA